MQQEFASLGYTVHFVAVNKSDATDYQERLIDRVGFSLVQDQDDINVWSLMNGNKDDMYVYGADGNLSDYLAHSNQEFSTNLSTPEGYETLFNAVLYTIEGPPEEEPGTTGEGTETTGEGTETTGEGAGSGTEGSTTEGTDTDGATTGGDTDGETTDGGADGETTDGSTGGETSGGSRDGDATGGDRGTGE